MSEKNVSGLDSDGHLTRVCRQCSVQSQASGDFCPNCGKSFVRKSISRRAKVLVGSAIGVVLLVGITSAIAFQVNANRAAEAADRREARELAETRRVAQEEEQARIDEEERLATEAADEEAARDEERELRVLYVEQLQKSVTKDARDKVGEGLLDGPIKYTSCDPLGGGSQDDLSALTTTYECLAVNEEKGDGTVEGWVFSATMNWDEGTYSWRLGRS